MGETAGYSAQPCGARLFPVPDVCGPHRHPGATRGPRHVVLCGEVVRTSGGRGNLVVGEARYHGRLTFVLLSTSLYHYVYTYEC